MRILTPSRPATDPTPRSILIWWNADIRLWTLQVMDREGNDLDLTEYDAHKGPLIEAAKHYYPDLPRAVGTRHSAPDPLTFPAEETPTMTAHPAEQITNLYAELEENLLKLNALIEAEIKLMAFEIGQKWAEEPIDTPETAVEMALPEIIDVLIGLAASNGGTESGGLSLGKLVQHKRREIALHYMQPVRRTALRREARKGYDAVKGSKA